MLEPVFEGHFILSVALRPYFCDLLPLNEPDSAAALDDLHFEEGLLHLVLEHGVS